MSEIIENEGRHVHAENSRSLYDTLNVLRRKIGKVIRHAMTGKIDPEDAIHPEFRITERIDADLTWYWNRETGGLMQRPAHKIMFFIHDPADLDDCEWVCKFGKNLNENAPEFPYIGFAYGDPSKKDFDFERMKQWASKFAHPTVLTYESAFVETLDGKDPLPPPSHEPQRKPRLRDLL